MAVRFRRFFRAWRGVFVLFGVMMLFRSAIADWVVVPSGSMNPTVIEGDRVLIDKRAYGWRIPFTLKRVFEVGRPRRGDVVILESPENSVTLFKRVVGVPGDVISLEGDRLVINGRMVAYHPAAGEDGKELLAATRAFAPLFLEEEMPGKAHEIMLLPQFEAARDFGPVVIPPDRYLMMGDNRDNSHDGRYFGLVSRDAIFGKALRVVVSLNPDEYLLPRRERFLAPTL